MLTASLGSIATPLIGRPWNFNPAQYTGKRLRTSTLSSGFGPIDSSWSVFAHELKLSAHTNISAGMPRRRISATVGVGDRHAPVAPERALGDLYSGGCLAALVLGEIDEPCG